MSAPLISTKPVDATAVVHLRLPRHLVDQLDDYCRYLDDAQGTDKHNDRAWVVLHALKRLFAGDKAFRARQGQRSSNHASAEGAGANASEN